MLMRSEILAAHVCRPSITENLAMEKLKLTYRTVVSLERVPFPRKKWWVGRPRDWNRSCRGLSVDLVALWLFSFVHLHKVLRGDLHSGQSRGQRQQMLVSIANLGKGWHMWNNRYCMPMYAILIENHWIDLVHHFVLTLPCSFHEPLNMSKCNIIWHYATL